MPQFVKCGLIQASHACGTDESLETIREANVAKHVRLIEQAAAAGVQMLCMQEIFTGPYFCAEQTPRWFDAVEQIPEPPLSARAEPDPARGQPDPAGPGRAGGHLQCLRQRPI